VSFNYLGQFDQLLADPPWLSWAEEASGPEQSPLGRREHLVEIAGLVSKGQLYLQWVYSTQCHRQGTVERVARDFLETLQALIAQCHSPKAGGYIPSDFPLAGLNEQKLSKLAALLGDT
jgi:non-ribosomal peptide synthase protein (TIGR01720 family)